MKNFSIINVISGINNGIFAANTFVDALDMLARGQGYADRKDAYTRTNGAWSKGLRIVEV